MNLRATAAGFLSSLAFQLGGPALGKGLADAAEEAARDREDRVRETYGGNITPPPTTTTRWLLGDIETAQHEADTGDISRAAQLYRWMRRDGTFSGILRTHTGGLVRLPRKFGGEPGLVAKLEGRNGRRGLFDLMYPSAELSLLAADGDVLGIGVGECLPVEGKSYTRFQRLEPEFLRYRWNENRWYYHSLAGPLPITPGDGRWILHCPGGTTAPWNNGSWVALGRAVVAKEHALLYRDNYSGKLANPARVAFSPQGATEEQHQAWFQRVMAWGVNTVFGLKPGYDVKLLESNGRGYEIFKDIIATSDQEIILELGSSPVLVTGGTGFSNNDVHKSIRADVLQASATALAYTLNTQGIPCWVNTTAGASALSSAPVVEYDVTPPRDLVAEASAMSAAAGAFTAWTAALQASGSTKRVDDARMVERFGVPIRGDLDGDGKVDALPGDDEEPDAVLVSDVVPETEAEEPEAEAA